ncbi:hypothetical protein B0T14DRAFT_533546 [Immersiella caudata]|uniref:HNH nuclease domain-containing protein n=1 Tax=Immersiella caudata TaxID=314043 RepID=A0AA39XG47_9PEZI|nr:hypothetical protein B0T14DRAFT_533546 [Immersiella caudata]
MDTPIQVNPSQSSPLHRHQSSLEGVLDFSAELPAERRPYSSPLLVRYTYEYARSQESRDVFLRAFFQSMRLSVDDEDVDLGDTEVETGLRSALFDFADYLLDNFFLLCIRPNRRRPAYHSAIQRVQGAQGFVGTLEQISALRGTSLVRDRHRCVVSRRFDLKEAINRTEHANPMNTLEVARILPHSLTRANPGAPLDPSREAALAILNMFDMGIAYLIKGADIDRPRNALTLTQRLHQLRAIDLPLPRLLAVRSAIAHILHLSAAGAYIDSILWDAEKHGIRPDGSTELGRFVHLGLGLGLAGERVTVV